MSDCLFCKIVDGDIPAAKVQEDAHFFAFRDINPQAPVHVLVIPKKEILNIAAAADEDQALLGHMMLVIRNVANQLGLEQGYRVIANCGSDGGQAVDHLHFHLLAGRQLKWPPG